MPTLHPDVMVTRRQRQHYVLNDIGEVIYTDKSIWRCLLWLRDQGWLRISVVVEDQALPIELADRILSAGGVEQQASTLNPFKGSKQDG